MRLLILFVITIGLSLLSAPSYAQSEIERVGRSGPVTSSGTPDIGGPFSLINQNGETVTQEDLKGKPHLIYFGFAYCPDVCPVDLQRLGAALKIADPQGDIFRPVFITIDPERDTAETLAAYVNSNSFPKGLMGLTGPRPEIEKTIRNYKGYAAKVVDEDNSAGYTFDHTNVIHLMDREGKWVESYTTRESVDDIAGRLSAYASKGSRLKKALLIACLVFLSVVFLIIGRMGKNALKTGDKETPA